MKIVSWCPWAAAELATALRRLPGAADDTVVHVKHRAELVAHLGDADALLIAGSGGFYDRALSRLVSDRAPRLRWIQCLTAGYDAFVELGVPGHVTLTSADGTNSAGVAEHGMSLLLSLVRRVPAMVAAQRGAQWAEALSSEVDTLEGKQVAIIGAGSLGQAFARLARAFGMRTVGINRSARSSPHVDEMRSLDAMQAVLRDSDVAVLALALSPQTRHIFGAAAMRALGPAGYLVNLGRGALVDHAALDEALRDGALGWAALDVTDPEPLPATHALWRNPRVLISPHLGGYGHPQSYVRLGDTVARHAAAFKRGGALPNQIRL